jgi:hypothetical protein
LRPSRMTFEVNSEAINCIIIKKGFLDAMQLYEEIDLISNKIKCIVSLKKPIFAKIVHFFSELRT